MQSLPDALVALAAFSQFIVYKLVPSESRPGKHDKFPIDHRTGWKADAHNPEIWLDSQNAIAIASSWGHPFGVGFVFTGQDPFFFLDIDSCLVNGQWSPVAQGLFGAFAGAAIEISQSGTGAHVIGVGRPPAHSCKNASYGLELYHTGRFCALTGIGAVGSAAFDCSATLPALVATYFPPALESAAAEWGEGPCSEWNGPKDDTELLRRAMQSQSTASAFGGKASFADLWQANVTALARSYPDANGRPYDASGADAALAQHLAFWTGKDCERIERLMRQSALARDKWDSHKTYLRELTILGAVSRQVEVLRDKAPFVIPDAPGEALKPTSKEGNQYLNPAQQLELFAGCVYLRDQHRALIPEGRILKPEQFKVHFGGYTFQMDNTNEKTTRDPWEAWTQSQAYSCPKADGACFKPSETPGAIVIRNGQSLVNTYFPVEIRRIVGDVSPFLNHLEKVLPNAQDREIFLSYMAACIQYKGIKFQWAPLLQGVEGNGKTLFTRCVAEAIGRPYVHWPKASKLSKEFNGWMVNKLFYAVEDIYVPDARREVIEELKPMITGGDGLEIERKGIDQISCDICGNFIFNSNHKDGIRKTANDRRFCLLFCAQQSAADLARDGMQGDYFPKLYEWLREDGYAIVAEYLSTYPIPETYNPAGSCQRAPESTSTNEAIKASTGNVEQEILEAVAQGLQGFAGGWISSIYLERLLDRLGLLRRVTHSKRKEMLEGLGYVYHPALIDGRVNNQVMPDGGKPRLWIRADSPARLIEGGSAAAKAYEDANKAVTNLPFALRG